MAKNRARVDGRHLWLSVANVNGTGTADACKSGDPGVIGDLPVVCTTDEDADGMASVDAGGAYNLAVIGKGAADANAAVAVGDALHWDNTGGRLVLAAFAGTSKFFGYALGAVAAGATTTIEVKVGR